MESYRTARGPRQRVVAWLGVMDEQGRLGVKRCAERTPFQQGSLFRLGRLLGRNTRAAALFDVQVEADAGGFARLRWSKPEAWRE